VAVRCQQASAWVSAGQKSATTDSEVSSVCRNIRTLYNIEPPATEEEIRAAASQYVRKVSGFNTPSAANAAAFQLAIADVAAATSALLGTLVTAAPARDRAVMAAQARERAARRFGRPDPLPDASHPEGAL
jgi:hypothetical protein